jgi:hypothetical protein
MTASWFHYGLGITLFAGVIVANHADAQPRPADSSGPQTLVPAPLLSGTPDVPGGSLHNGVIRPPPTAGRQMRKIEAALTGV